MVAPAEEPPMTPPRSRSFVELELRCGCRDRRRRAATDGRPGTTPRGRAGWGRRSRPSSRRSGRGCGARSRSRRRARGSGGLPDRTRRSASPSPAVGMTTMGASGPPASSMNRFRIASSSSAPPTMTSEPRAGPTSCPQTEPRPRQPQRHEPQSSHTAHPDSGIPSDLMNTRSSVSGTSRVSCSLSDEARRHRHRRTHRSRQERSRSGAHGYRSGSPQGGEGAGHHHRARLCVSRGSRRALARLRRCPGPREVREEHARRRRRHRCRSARRRGR